MSGLVQAFESFLGHWGTLALFVTLTLESLGAPLPGESALIAASAASARGAFPLWQVVLAAWAGAVLGDNLGYLIGRKLGRDALIRVGGRFGVTEGAIARTEQVARRWGPFMVVAARFVAVLRQLNGIVAGTTGMSWPKFIAANAVGAALWVGVWTTLAFRFGHDLSIVPWLWHHLALVAMVVIPALVAALIFLKARRRHTA
jgi:membrane protein DedA with SNARE-associated domain